jgi:hypothetical protein
MPAAAFSGRLQAGENPVRSFCQPTPGRRMEVSNDMGNRVFCFCVLGCFGFFLGCQSSPAVYEIIEVKHGETMLDMHRRFRGGEAGQMPEVPAANRSWHRQNQDTAKACRDDSKACKAILGAGELFHAIFD